MRVFYSGGHNAINVFIARCVRPEAYYVIFSHSNLRLTNQLEPVEGSTNKTGLEGLSEWEKEILMHYKYISVKNKL